MKMDDLKHLMEVIAAPIKELRVRMTTAEHVIGTRTTDLEREVAALKKRDELTQSRLALLEAKTD